MLSCFGLLCGNRVPCRGGWPRQYIRSLSIRSPSSVLSLTSIGWLVSRLTLASTYYCYYNTQFTAQCRYGWATNTNTNSNSRSKIQDPRTKNQERLRDGSSACLDHDHDSKMVFRSTTIKKQYIQLEELVLTSPVFEHRTCHHWVTF